MKNQTFDVVTSIILVTFVFGLFSFAAAIRIKKNLEALRNESKPKSDRWIRKLDLVFSGVILVTSLTFYIIFIVNMGK